jgi:hypothetical protein
LEEYEGSWPHRIVAVLLLLLLLLRLLLLLVLLLLLGLLGLLGGRGGFQPRHIHRLKPMDGLLHPHELVALLQQ